MCGQHEIESCYASLDIMRSDFDVVYVLSNILARLGNVRLKSIRKVWGSRNELQSRM